MYVSDYELEYEDLYCETCGDSDRLLGYAETRKDAWKLLEPITDIDGSGGWNYNYVQNLLNENWDK